MLLLGNREELREHTRGRMNRPEMIRIPGWGEMAFGLPFQEPNGTANQEGLFWKRRRSLEVMGSASAC